MRVIDGEHEVQRGDGTDAGDLPELLDLGELPCKIRESPVAAVDLSCYQVELFE
jgi:hypothetical protein